MRILLLTSEEPEAHTGPGVLVRETVRAILAEPPNTVTVAAIVTAPASRARVAAQTRARALSPVVPLVARLERGEQGRGMIARALLRLPLTAVERRFTKFAAEQSSRATFALWFGSAWDPITTMLPRVCRCPVIHHPNDSITLFERRRVRVRLRAGRERLAALQERRALSAGYAASVYVSPSDAGVARRLVPAARVEMLPLGIDLAAFHPASADAAPAHILFSGVMAYGPNHDAAMHLIASILPHLPPSVRVRLAGRDPLPELRAAAARDSRVEVTGSVEDMGAEYRRAAVFAAPIVSGAGFRNKLLEAMASGLPIVATSLAVEGFGATPPGVVVADEPGSFAARLMELLADGPRRATLARAARAFVESGWSWEQRTARLLAMARGG